MNLLAFTPSHLDTVSAGSKQNICKDLKKGLDRDGRFMLLILL
jgi:hypothetical protein